MVSSLLFIYITVCESKLLNVESQNAFIGVPISLPDWRGKERRRKERRKDFVILQSAHLFPKERERDFPMEKERNSSIGKEKDGFFP